MALRKFRYSRNETGGARPAANVPPEPMVRRRSTPLAACPYPYPSPCPFPWVCPVVSAAVAVDAQAAVGALPEAVAAVVAAPPAAVDAQAAAGAPAAHLQADRWPAGDLAARWP